MLMFHFEVKGPLQQILNLNFDHWTIKFVQNLKKKQFSKKCQKHKFLLYQLSDRLTGQSANHTKISSSAWWAIKFAQNWK